MASDEDRLKYYDVDSESAELLKKYFVNKFREGYVKCKGVLLPNYFRKFGDEIRKMEIRDDDVWVCSFPKAGTTWTQEMVWCIVNNLDFKGAEQFLPERFPFLEHSPLFNYEELLAKNPEMTFPHYVLNSVDYINKKSSPRFIKSHLPYFLLPTKLQKNSTNAKIVYVARNAKDTCVSYYHHSTLLEGFKGDFKTFCELFLKDAVGFAPFWEHVLSYWEQKENNVLFLKYEDMKKDLKSVIRKTASFFNKDLSEEDVDRLAEHLKFENMKNNRAVNYEPVVEINKKYNLIEADGSFMRCGKVGEWKALMTSDISERFAKLEKEKISGTGFAFENNQLLEIV